MWICSCLSTNFVRKTIIFPIELSWQSWKSIGQKVRVNFWILSSIPLIPMSILMLVPHCLFCLFGFLGLHLWHMEVPSLGVELELQLSAHVTTTAMPDPSHIGDLHHSSRQYWILNPLNEARDQTLILMDTSGVHYHWATMGTPVGHLFMCLLGFWVSL